MVNYSFWEQIEKKLGFASNFLIGIYSYNKVIGQRSYDVLYNVLHAIDDGAEDAEEQVANLPSSLPEKPATESNSRRMAFPFCFLSPTLTFNCLLIALVGDPPNDDEVKSFEEQVKSMIDLWLLLYKTTETKIRLVVRIGSKSITKLEELYFRVKSPTLQEVFAARPLTRDAM